MDTPVDWDSAPGTTVSGGDLLVGRSEAMQQVYKQVGRVAPQNVTVLITGESGTGKELVARAIYQHSGRSNSKFLAINCAAIPESLLESELFGHEKGAFTGAEQRRIGKFEQCTGGTLFLDEIGDMSPSTQSKILRVLQEQRFERVGGTETIQTDVRIIAATHHDLQQLTRTGRFRTDLFYRLNGFTIHLPPLRERGEDLPLLLNHFLNRFSNQMGKDVQRIPPETLELLNHYDWPGNIRELQSVLKNAILQSTGPELLADFLSGFQQDSPAAGPDTPSSPSGSSQEFVRQRLRNGSTNLYKEALRQMERQLLTQVLRHTGGNQLKAAEILGMTRGTLRKKIRLLDIQIERVVDEGGQAEPTAPE
jgi:two-component system nitrogen regulation response regulator GlnG